MVSREEIMTIQVKIAMEQGNRGRHQRLNVRTAFIVDYYLLRDREEKDTGS